MRGRLTALFCVACAGEPFVRCWRDSCECFDQAALASGKTLAAVLSTREAPVHAARQRRCRAVLWGAASPLHVHAPGGGPRVSKAPHREAPAAANRQRCFCSAVPGKAMGALAKEPQVFATKMAFAKQRQNTCGCGVQLPMALRESRVTALSISLPGALCSPVVRAASPVALLLAAPKGEGGVRHPSRGDRAALPCFAPPRRRAFVRCWREGHRGCKCLL